MKTLLQEKPQNRQEKSGKLKLMQIWFNIWQGASSSSGDKRGARGVGEEMHSSSPMGITQESYNFISFTFFAPFFKHLNSKYKDRVSNLSIEDSKMLWHHLNFYTYLSCNSEPQP